MNADIRLHAVRIAFDVAPQGSGVSALLKVAKQIEQYISSGDTQQQTSGQTDKGPEAGR